MKNIYVLFFGLLFGLIGISAQDKSLGYDQTWTRSDSVDSYEQSTASDSIIDYEVFKRTNQYVKTSIEQGYDSVSGTASTVNIYLQKKMFDTDDYVDVDTVIWSATTSDTVINFNISTSIREEYYKVVAIPDNASFIYGLNYSRFKFQY